MSFKQHAFLKSDKNFLWHVSFILIILAVSVPPHPSDIYRSCTAQHGMDCVLHMMCILLSPLSRSRSAVMQPVTEISGDQFIVTLNIMWSSQYCPRALNLSSDVTTYLHALLLTKKWSWKLHASIFHVWHRIMLIIST